ncbi:membrane protein, partial [Achromatium sp. WMS2]
MIIKQVHILSTKYPLIFLLLIALMWIGLYSWLDLIARFLVALLPVAPDGHFGKSLQFFFYDTPKVLLLLTSTVFIMGIVHTFISPEVTRALLSGKRLGLGNILAATLGIVTPFCSCSAVPLFIGFLQAGVPLGVTFSFLIAAPMVNEVALVLLLGLFGWKIAIFYLSMGLLIAIVAGLLIGNLNMERYLEDWVQAMQNTRLAEVPNISMTWGERIHHGFQHAHDIVIKVWSYIVLGIGLGALIH